MSRRVAITLVTAILSLVAAALGIVPSVRDIMSYRSKPAQIEEIANEVLKRASEQMVATTPGIVVEPPKVTARAEGPDLVLEVGEGLGLEIRATSFGDGETTVEAIITDYPVGCYRIREAPNSLVLIETLKSTLTSVLGPTYVSDSAAMEIVGTADGVPVRAGRTYEGDLGTLSDVSYYSHDDKCTKKATLIPGASPLTNELFAFLRAYDAAAYLREIPALAQATTQYATITTPRVGGAYRQSVIHIRIPGALDMEFANLSPLERRLDRFFR